MSLNKDLLITSILIPILAFVLGMPTAWFLLIPLARMFIPREYAFLVGVALGAVGFFIWYVILSLIWLNKAFEKFKKEIRNERQKLS